jgi:hypothetical protein
VQCFNGETNSGTPCRGLSDTSCTGLSPSCRANDRARLDFKAFKVLAHMRFALPHCILSSRHFCVHENYTKRRMYGHAPFFSRVYSLLHHDDRGRMRSISFTSNARECDFSSPLAQVCYKAMEIVPAWVDRDTYRSVVSHFNIFSMLTLLAAMVQRCLACLLSHAS